MALTELDELKAEIRRERSIQATLKIQIALAKRKAVVLRRQIEVREVARRARCARLTEVER